MLANGGMDLTLILLTWTIWRAPTNASKWRMGFNPAFKGLNIVCFVTNWHNMKIHFEATESKVLMCYNCLVSDERLFTRLCVPISNANNRHDDNPHPHP